MTKKSFKEFYSEFDEVNEDEYHYVTMEQLRQIFTEEEINQHIDLNTKEDLISNDISRTLELKNWLDYIKIKNNG